MIKCYTEIRAEDITGIFKEPVVDNIETGGIRIERIVNTQLICFHVNPRGQFAKEATELLSNTFPELKIVDIDAGENSPEHVSNAELNALIYSRVRCKNTYILFLSWNDNCMKMRLYDALMQSDMFFSTNPTMFSAQTVDPDRYKIHPNGLIAIKDRAILSYTNRFIALD